MINRIQWQEYPEHPEYSEYCEDLRENLLNAFELDSKAGDSPSIEKYLQQVGQAQQGVLFLELLNIELHWRRHWGSKPSVEEYLDRFPQFESLIHELPLAAFHPSGPPLMMAHFRLTKKIGEGASGTVWKAMNVRTGGYVALKIPHVNQAPNLASRALFKEAQAAAKVQHDNIVRVFDVDEFKGLPFIVSEIIDGVDLKHRMAHYLASPKQAAAMCATVADAIHCAHMQQIIHRDLKPANILLDADLVPHITDFGLAKQLETDETQTKDGHVLGTPAYMAPEQAAGKPSQVDQRTDIYSLGVILYELLTGQIPFSADSEGLIYQKIIQETPLRPRKLRKEIPRDLETICLKAIEKRPTDRYQSAAEMEVDLQRYLQGESPLARRPGIVKRASRNARRHPLLTSLLTILLAVSVSFAMFAAGAAAKKRAILGIKTMNVVTLPAGAEVVFVPLSELTGEPDPSQIIRAEGRTPLSVDLAPGDYLVVVKLDNGWFHEVYRHVPRNSENMAGIYNHQHWELQKDGSVAMPPIWIRPVDVVADMAQVPACPAFDSYLLGTSGSPVIYDMASFYIDTTEVTSAEYQKIWLRQQAPDSRSTLLQPGWAMTLTYDFAIATAEFMGKRLPSAAEYEYAATAAGTRDYSWSKEANLPTEIEEFGNAGEPIVDSVKFKGQRVYGLCSNVAEWTTTFPSHGTPDGSFAGSNYRLVGGGNWSVISGDPSVTLETRNPRHREAVEINTIEEGLGFRCVRSARPRMTAADFGAPQQAH